MLKTVPTTWKLFAVAALLVAGCSSPPPPATPVNWKDFNSQANNDKQVSLEGYVRLPAAALISDTMLLELHEQQDGKGANVSFSTYLGSSANQVEKPPENYKETDLKLHANDGSLVAAGDKVRVAGKLIYASGGNGTILMGPIDVQKL